MSRSRLCRRSSALALEVSADTAARRDAELCMDADRPPTGSARSYSLHFACVTRCAFSMTALLLLVTIFGAQKPRSTAAISLLARSRKSSRQAVRAFHVSLGEFEAVVGLDATKRLRDFIPQDGRYLSRIRGVIDVDRGYRDFDPAAAEQGLKIVIGMDIAR